MVHYYTLFTFCYIVTPIASLCLFKNSLQQKTWQLHCEATDVQICYQIHMYYRFIARHFKCLSYIQNYHMINLIWQMSNQRSLKSHMAKLSNVTVSDYHMIMLNGPIKTAYFAF